MPPHINPVLFSLPSKDPLIIAAALCYIASALTAQKTLLPTVLILLRTITQNNCYITGYFTVVA
jgi:hypothetical protein